MASAADGAYEGGAGGKLRRKPLRRAATPYDRPPTAIRNSSEAERNGWLLKIVDPASRIITRGAQRLFSSVFRKTLPAPPTVSETNHEPQTRDEFCVAVSFNPSGAQDKVSNEVNRPTDSSDVDSIGELEKVLKQKTFTREEIDRLTELLRSRTVDVEGQQKQKIEPNTSQPVVLKENGTKMQSFVEDVLAPVVNARVFEDDVASPAELAKAYMGRRSSGIAPSPLGLHSQAYREDVISLSNASFAPKSPCMPLAPRSAVRFASAPGVSENSYMTPTRRGRSAIYSMARTPYSRMNNYAALKGVEPAVDATVDPSSPRWSWENNNLSVGNQVSKRRSSVLDNDIGSVGPIRRIRRKTNMVSPSKSASLAIPRAPLLSSSATVCTDVAQGSASSKQNLLLLDEAKHNMSSHRLVENLDKNIADMGVISVPSQSNEMARKILQQLDKLVPSPKEKSSELKLAATVGKTPTKLTPGMLHGQALRSMEDVDSSKLLNNIEGIHTINVLGGGAHVSASQDSNPQTQVRIEENGPTKVPTIGVKLASETNGLVKKSVKETLHSVDADLVISNSVSDLPQKKRGFQISAHEDSLEFDDTTDKEKPDSSVTLTKTNADDTESAEKRGISSSGTVPIAISTLKTTKDVRNSEVLPAAKKNASFTFNITHAPSNIPETAMPTSESSSLLNGAVPLKESTTAPVFSFGSKSVNRAASFTFSSMSTMSEASAFKIGAQADSKPEISTSAATVAVRITEATSSATEVDKGHKGKPQEAGNLRQEDAVPSSSLAPTTQLFSFGASMSNLSPKKDSFSSSASLFSVPAIPPIPSGSASNTIFSSASINAVTAETTASIVSTPTSSTFSPVPAFQFGSSTSAAAPSDSASLHSVASGVEPAGTEPKAKETPSFGSLNGSSSGATSSAFAGISSGASVYDASAPSTTISTTSANNLFQSSSPANGTSGSLSFTTGTTNALFSQGMPLQFGSAASTPAFGSSGSPFSSGSSLFSSSSASNLFGTSSGFSMSSSTTSTGASSFSFSAGTASSVSGSSLQSGPSSIFGSATPVTGFSFGLSSATASVGSIAPVPFGSSVSASSGSMFSFTSAAPTTSSAPPSLPFPSFGSMAPAASMATASPGNDQMNMEDSMAEDTIQAPSLVVPGFGQPTSSPPLANFTFGTPSQSGGPALFQFGGQQNPLTPQNPSPFQAPNNLEFPVGGSFSLGTGGVDKSGRKIIKVNRTKLRKR